MKLHILTQKKKKKTPAFLTGDYCPKDVLSHMIDDKKKKSDVVDSNRLFVL